MEKTASLKREHLPHQGKGTEIAKGSEPNSIFENRGNLCNSSMLAIGMEFFRPAATVPEYILDNHKEHSESKIK